MSSVNVDEVGLRGIAENYNSLANLLSTGIESFGSAIDGLVQNGISGDEAPPKLSQLWYTNIRGYAEGLKGVMETYVTELRNSSLKIEDYLANLSAVDTGKAEELDSTVQATQQN